MPIYEYKCAKCGVVEVMQGIKEAPLKKCPNCKSKVERMISSSSFVLKGSGWYATDYAKKSPSPAESSGSTNGATENGAAKSSAADASASKAGAASEKSATPSDSNNAAAASTDKPAKAAKPASTKSAAGKPTD
jgi:putative FmdB family regulatory protein